MRSVAIKLSLFGFAAVRAALRLVLQAFFLVEFLFTFGEDEFLGAVFANYGLVWHGYLLIFRDRTFWFEALPSI